MDRDSTVTLDEIENDPYISIPDNGIALAEVPTQEELSNFDRARINGLRVPGVYVAEHFAIRILRSGSARVYPLDGRDHFILRDCDGSIVGRAYRDTPASIRRIEKRLSKHSLFARR